VRKRWIRGGEEEDREESKRANRTGRKETNRVEWRSGGGGVRNRGGWNRGAGAEDGMESERKNEVKYRKYLSG
jgi:hypothetical protein